MSRLFPAVVFVFLIAALAACSGSKKPEPSVATDEGNGVRTRLDAMMRVASPCTGAVLVSEDGKVIYKGLVGPPASPSLAGVTTESRFLIASLTKQFTAVLVMQQVERGKLDLEGAVTTYLPEYPATGHAVTLHHLLSHTSGIPSYTPIFPASALTTRSCMRLKKSSLSSATCLCHSRPQRIRVQQLRLRPAGSDPGARDR